MTNFFKYYLQNYYYVYAINHVMYREHISSTNVVIDRTQKTNHTYFSELRETLPSELGCGDAFGKMSVTENKYYLINIL